MAEIIEDKCVWHESQSLTRGNPMYGYYHTKCDGYIPIKIMNENCRFYKTSNIVKRE